MMTTMTFLPRLSTQFAQVKHLSSLASKEQIISLKTCGKFYAANNKKFIYRNGTADGININVKYLDTNPSTSNIPTILAVHGAPGNYSDFQDLIEKLHGKGYRVIAPNFPTMQLTDETRTFYHSTEEKYEMLTDFLAAIEAPSFDLALMHSGGVYSTMKLWNDKPGSIRSLVWINPAGHRRIRAMRPPWFVDNLARVNLVPAGRWFFKNLGYIIAKAAKVKVNASKEHADNAVLACLTMYFAGVERLAGYAASLASSKTPTSYFYSDRDKLVEKEIFQELVQMLGATEQNVNIASQGAIVKAAEKELDWLRIFNMQGGGHYAFKSNTQLLDQEITRLVEKVRSAKKESDSKGKARDMNVDEAFERRGRAYAVNMTSFSD